MTLTDRVALVTGAGGGFGRAISKALAADGAHVLVTDLLESGSETAEEVGGTFIQADISTMEGTNDLGRRALEEAGGVDILVNNAGIQKIHPVDEFPDDEWATMIQIMLNAPFQLTRAVVPGMKERGWGRIINISSIHGLVASPYKSAYNAAKHGIIGLTKTVALEVGDYGITVNSICPGYANTPLAQRQIGDQSRTLGIPEDEVVRDVMLAPAAIKRLVEPDEIASMAAYLSSDAARSITGASISVDAGWTAR